MTPKEKAIEFIKITWDKDYNTWIPKQQFEKAIDIALQEQAKEINKKLSSVMNVRNNEKDMRLLIIELQKHLKGDGEE